LAVTGYGRGLRLCSNLSGVRLLDHMLMTLVEVENLNETNVE